MVPVGGCVCVHILYTWQMTLFLSSLQLQQPVLHGRSDRLGDEVPLLIEFCPSRLGHAQLPGGKKLHHKDSRLWHEQKSVQRRLLSHPRQSGTANTLDVMGEHLAGEDETLYQ